MSFKLIGGGSSLETVVSDVNQNILELKGQEQTKVIKDEAGTRVVILDKDGLRTTAPGSGIDVFTADDSELTFNSNQNIFKIVATGTTTITPPATMNGADPETVTIPHNLGFAPAFSVFVTNPNLSGVADVSTGLTNLPSTVYITNGGNIVLVSYASVDSTNLYINLVYLGTASAAGLNAYTWSYKYYIYQETAS